MTILLRFTRPSHIILACLMSLLVSACTAPNHDLANQSAALCANPIRDNFGDALSPREGEVVCVEGYLGRSTTFDFVAIPADRHAEDETRRVLLVGDIDLRRFQPASRIRATGMVTRPSGCDAESLPDSSPCWDGPSNLILDVSEVQIAGRPSPDEQCHMLAIESIREDPLRYAYQYVCLDGVVSVEGGMIDILPMVPFGEAEDGVIDWGALDEYNFQSGDQVRLEGLLIPDESCVGPEQLCLFTPRPFHFTDATATLLD